MSDRRAGAQTKLSLRLTAAADMVRPGARLIDVGTDHAYLPVFLAQNGRIAAALATDIAQGPLTRARAHIAKAKPRIPVETRQTPGLTGVNDFCPTDIVIAGMGGELIASILEEARFVRDRKIALVLQPMTKQAELRRFLARAGFECDREELVREDGRYYQVFRVFFTGKPCEISPLEAEVGRLTLEKGGQILSAYLEKKKQQLEKAAAGKRRGGEDCAAEECLLSEIANRLERKDALI